ncbi:hypothetical protein HAHE_19520 [Haloferula helveola]|uniref:Uncharacterized protein n=1 Tax=Haloferula helveola TaxID=490095 RepID=A0ABN6H640_9BACT|nr:hypothetical protein HAHE_19520 [Haloferula helveola]
MNFPSTISQTLRPAARLACVALGSLALNSSALAQEPESPPVILGPIELDLLPGGACVITFEAEPDLQFITLTTDDLQTWSYLGCCQEIYPGTYEYLDLGACELPGCFYQIELIDQPVELPPQFEQLRMELGDESFAEWLRSNAEQTGSLQGINESEVDDDSGLHQQFLDLEKALELWLEQFEKGQEPPVGQDTGETEPPLGGEGSNEPPSSEEDPWVPAEEDDSDPVIVNPQSQGVELPPQFEELRRELGDESFEQWLRENLRQFGSLQGVSTEELNELQRSNPSAYEELMQTESLLEQWLAR